MDQRIESIVEIMEKFETRINAYWNFYFILVLATIGWLMSSRTPFTTSQAIALTIALCMFFITSYFMIHAATKRTLAFEDELNLLLKYIELNSSVLKSELSATSIRYRLIATGVLHGIIDIAVIYAIWSKLS